MTRTVLVTGGSGQVGIEVRRLDWPGEFDVRAPSREQLDVGDPSSVKAYFADLQPACVINLAAYTGVDQAEAEVSAAFLANSQGPTQLAEIAHERGSPLLHVSTDYVFDGSSKKPYREDDPTRPLSAYGASKLAGELGVRAANPRSLVLRTAWVLSAHRKNFLKTMLRIAEGNDEVRVVADQIGCPTSARDIAVTLRQMALRAMDDPGTPWGVYHFVNAGECSWHELAEYIFDDEERRGRNRPRVQAITTSGFPTPARRPQNSRLDTSLIRDKFGIVARPWREAVDEILMELAEAREEKRNEQ